MLFPAVPAGILFPVGPVGPVGAYGTLSLSDSESVGPYGTLSPSATVAVGPVGPYGTLSLSDSDSVGPYERLSPSDSESVGPVGPYGTLSPFNSDSAGPCRTLSPPDAVTIGPVGPGGTLSSTDLAGILFPAVPAGILFPVGPVGPIGPCRTLSPSDSDSTILVDPGGALPSFDLAGMMVPDDSAESAFLMGPVGPAMTLEVSDTDSADPVVPTRMLSSSVFEYAGPLGPVGTLLPGEDGTGLFPIVQTGELLSVVAVPLPAERDRAITQLAAEGLVGECSVYKSVTEHGGRSAPEVVATPAMVVAMVGFDVMPMGEDTPLDRVDQ